ncbi:hypothetical protein BGX21_006379 [Mortierella sp. AD011]|nr:hypothetical protein BGX20_000011 [Mortierella sp. AD010]KAF9403196.1 hypothetical protein BGX21_006379 [Mortierella sp. AD011]
MLQNPFSSSKGKLSVNDTLGLANEALENAHKAKANPGQALQFCNNAKSRIEDAENVISTKKSRDPTLSDSIANAYHEHGKLLDELGQRDKALKSHSKAEKWGYVPAISQGTDSFQPVNTGRSIRQLTSPTTVIYASLRMTAMSQGVSEAPHSSHQDSLQDDPPLRS